MVNGVPSRQVQGYFCNKEEIPNSPSVLYTWPPTQLLVKNGSSHVRSSNDALN